MAGPGLQIDFSNLLDSAVGPIHGLGTGEIRRSLERVAPLVERIEKERAAGRHRYRDLPDDRAMLAAARDAIRRYRRGFENLVVLGIGGSALGNIALQTALNPPYHNLMTAGRAAVRGGQRTPARRRGPRLFVMDNVDPVQFANLLDVLGPALRRTLFNVISKSGETAETAAQFLIVRDLLARRLGTKAMVKQMLVTTDAKSGTMREIVDAGGFDALPVPEGVGGRFSVLSAVGLFSAGMCGIDIGKLLSGAAEVSRRAAERKVEQNPAAMLALLLYLFYVRGKRLHVMMPYSHQLKDLSDWYRQLWAESLGKRQDLDGNVVHVGPTPIKALGATDQHSQVQLYREGPNDKVFTLLELAKFARDVKIPHSRDTHESLRYLEGATLGKLLNAEKRATEFALVASQRPNLTIRFPAVNEHTVGQFIMLWEAATTFMGGLLNIDPYDQPAVELGKQMTFALMGRKGYEAQAVELEQATGRRTAAIV